MKPLILIASEREGLGLVETLALHPVEGFQLLAQLREPRAGLYVGERCSLLISGVFEHHMTAASIAALKHLDFSPSVVINFGAAGSYRGLEGHPEAPAIGEVVIVETSYRFDVGDNLHWAPPIALPVPDLGLRSVTCVTGSRYSTPQDRASPYFPADGDVEDMELYALAVLMKTLEIPLYSLKFVTNIVEAEGLEDFRQHVRSGRDRAEECLLQLLSQISA